MEVLALIRMLQEYQVFYLDSTTTSDTSVRYQCEWRRFNDTNIESGYYFGITVQISTREPVSSPTSNNIIDDEDDSVTTEQPQSSNDDSIATTGGTNTTTVDPTTSSADSVPTSDASDVVSQENSTAQQPESEVNTIDDDDDGGDNSTQIITYATTDATATRDAASATITMTAWNSVAKLSVVR